LTKEQLEQAPLLWKFNNGSSFTKGGGGPIVVGERQEDRAIREKKRRCRSERRRMVHKKKVAHDGFRTLSTAVCDVWARWSALGPG